MTIKLPPDKAQQLQASIKRYFAEHLDQDIGDLKAGMLLDYCLKEVCPIAYNQAIADAQEYFQGRAVDLEGVCHHPEFSYWTPAAPDRGSRSRK